MAGHDPGDVLSIVPGSERIHPATLRRFSERFAKFNLRGHGAPTLDGVAEATAYVATRRAGQPPEIVHFESDELSAGNAKRCRSGGTALVSYGVLQSSMVRIVDPDTRTCKAGTLVVPDVLLRQGMRRRPVAGYRPTHATSQL